MVANVAKAAFPTDLASPLLLDFTPETKRIRMPILRPGGVYRLIPSVFESNPVEIVKEGIRRLDYESIWEDRGNS